MGALSRITVLVAWSRRFALADPPWIGPSSPRLGTRVPNFCAAAPPARRAGGVGCSSCCSLALLLACRAGLSGGSTSAGAAFWYTFEVSFFFAGWRGTRRLRMSVPTSAAERLLPRPPRSAPAGVVVILDPLPRSRRALGTQWGQHPWRKTLHLHRSRRVGPPTRGWARAGGRRLGLLLTQLGSIEVCWPAGGPQGGT